MNTLTKKAIDPGFGNFKIAWLEAGHIQTRIIPSVVGIGRIADLSALGLGRQRQPTRPLTVSFLPLSSQERGSGGEVSYLVGHDIHHYADPIEDLDYQRLSEGLVNRCLTYAALGSAVNGHGHTPSPGSPPSKGGAGGGLEGRTALILGFPVEVMKDQDQAKAQLHAARSWLLGPHHFTLDDRPVDLVVEQVRAIAQPVGAYFDWGLDERGEWIREKDALKQPVGICDVGFNTLDLFAVENGQIVNRFTDGDNLGLHRVARTVRRHIHDHYDVKWGLSQADALVRRYLATHRAIFYCAAGEIDLGGAIRQALEQTFIAVNEFIAARWQGGRQFYRLIIVGGGAHALRDQFLRHYPTAYLPPDPITANARGMAKWAERIFKD